METLRSKRRPVKNQDDEVEAAIKGARRRLRYNPILNNRWKLVGAVIFLYIFFTTIWPFMTSHGPSGSITALLPVVLQLIIGAGYAAMYIGLTMGLASRSRIYWIKPGETGLTFKDYKGNPEVLGAAREIVDRLDVHR